MSVKLRDLFLLTRKSHIPLRICDQYNTVCAEVNAYMICDTVGGIHVVEITMENGELYAHTAVASESIREWKLKYNKTIGGNV